MRYLPECANEHEATSLSIEVRRLLIFSISSLLNLSISGLLGEESWLDFSSVRAMFA